MKCCKIHNELIFYLEGGLDDKKRREINDHLLKCEKCKAFAYNLEYSLNVIEKEKELHPNPFLYTRIQERIEAYDKRPNAFITSASKILRPVFVTALIVFGVFAGIKLGNYFNDKYVGNVSEIQIETYYLNDLQHESLETSLLSEEFVTENIN